MVPIVTGKSSRMGAPLALPLSHHFHHPPPVNLTFPTQSRTTHCSSSSDASASSNLLLTLINRPPKYLRFDDPEYRKWKDKESRILQDVGPIISRTKHILHSDRYMDGERLKVEDERVVIEKLLAHHPHSEDKVGSGIDSIMVDRHPLFKQSRCLFVVRTDGGWIDFSYQKCLRAYIRDKYPADAQRFIKEHFKRGSG